MTFALRKHETPSLSDPDYQAIMDEVKSRGVKTVLEFGPGSTTLALLEGGAEKIITCEYDPVWFDHYTAEFKKFPQVRVVRYDNVAPAAFVHHGLAGFDMALVDSPKAYRPHPLKPAGGFEPLPGQEDCARLNTCLTALAHAPVVILHDAQNALIRATLGRLNAMGYRHFFKMAQRQTAYAIIKR